VISPEGPARAFEHFEHEAAGMLVDRAFEDPEIQSIVKGRLASIDPLQKFRYDDVTGISGMIVDPNLGITMRAVQAFALKSHFTQRDATVIGLENLPNFAYEYYRVLKWDLIDSLTDYLAPREYTSYSSKTPQLVYF
jgi:hypothetical protein